MRHFLIITILFLSLSFLYGKKVASFTEFVNPFSICVDSEHLYISQGVTIFIYSLQNYGLIKKFGREGEGPGEFYLRRRGGNDQILLHLADKHLIVSTTNKLVYFTKNGEYIKELKTAGKKGRWFVPFNDLFVAKRYIREEDKKLYHTIALFDSSFQQIEEIYRHLHGFQGVNIEFNPLTVDQADFDIAAGYIFIIDGNRAFIRVFDQKGKLLAEMQNKDELVPFTKKDREVMIRGFQQNALWKRMYETRKHLFKFPKYFPPIRWFFLDPVKKRVYLKTQKKEDGKRKWLVFDFQGKLVRRLNLHQGLFRFYNGNGYCLVENEEQEVWELHTFKVE